MASDRRMLSVRIGSDARAALDDFCVEQGISLTAMIEALGLQVLRLADGDAPDHVAATVGDAVKVARRIDAERRSRG